MTSTKTPIQLPRGIFYGWVVVITGWSGNLVSALLNPVVFSVFIDPMREDLGVGLGPLAWAISLRMLTGGLATPIIGRIVDNYGARWIGCAGGILCGGVLICLYFAENIWVIYALFAISGFAGFGTFGATQLLTVVPVANWFVKKRGRATSITATGVGLGTALGIPIALLLINTIGWRSAWLVFGLVIWLVMIPAYGIFMRRRPEDIGLLPDGASSSTAPDSTGLGTVPYEETSWTLSEAMRTPVLWFILAALVMYGFSSAGVLFLRVPFWNEMGISTQAIAVGVALDPFTVIFAFLIFGFLAEKYPVRLFAVVGGIWRAISMLPLFLGAGNATQVYLHNITWGIGSGSFGTAQNLVIPTYFGRIHQGAIGGLMLPLMIIAGALGAPTVGYLIDSGMDPKFVWQMGLLMMLVPGLMFLFLKPPTRISLLTTVKHNTHE